MFFLLLFFLYGWIPIGELCTFYFFFRSSDFPLANPPRNLRYSLFFGFTFVQICNCGGLKRVIFLSFPYSLPLWYVYEHILPPKSPTVNRFFQFFHFSFLLYHSVIPWQALRLFDIIKKRNQTNTWLSYKKCAELVFFQWIRVFFMRSALRKQRWQLWCMM